MSALRNLLMSLWCAIIAGAGVFSLLAIYMYSGGNDVVVGATWKLWISGAFLALFALVALARPKLLWGVVVVCVLSIVLGENPYSVSGAVIGFSDDGILATIITAIVSVGFLVWEIIAERNSSSGKQAEGVEA